MRTIRHRQNFGFTLIELMIVITVIAILAAIVLFGLNQAQKRARDVQRLQIVRAVQNSLQSYFADKAAYPVGASLSWGGTGNFLDTAGAFYPYTSALYDPGCGSSANTYDVRAEPYVFPGSTTVTGCTGQGPMYGYQLGIAAGSNCPAGTPYTLAQVKESGGTTYLCGPQ